MRSTRVDVCIASRNADAIGSSRFWSQPPTHSVVADGSVVDSPLRCHVQSTTLETSRSSQIDGYPDEGGVRFGDSSRAGSGNSFFLSRAQWWFDGSNGADFATARFHHFCAFCTEPVGMCVREQAVSQRIWIAVSFVWQENSLRRS